MDTAEVQELQSSLRSMFAGTADNPGGVAAELRDLGWDDVVSEEPTAAAILFEEHGRAQAVSSLLDEEVLASLGLEVGGSAVAYPLRLAGDLAEPFAASDGSELILDAVLRGAGENWEKVLVPCDTSLFLVPADALERTVVTGLDPDGGWSRVTTTIKIRDQWAAHAVNPWSDAVATGRRMLAAELVGLARTALDIATNHVTERKQFGQSIGAFQAVRFRLAEAKVAVEAAAEATRLAFAAPSPLASAVAKALAGTAVDSTVRHAAQVCGAMGLTWEFPLHPVIRRSMALDMLLGGTADLTLALGRQVAGSARLPQVDPLIVAP